MANSRMMLTCRACGAQFVLAKGYYGEYYTKHPETLGYYLNDFLDVHTSGMCVPGNCNCADDAKEHFVILEEGDDIAPYLYDGGGLNG